ncbi:hypothetical protein CC85DRAFT_292952 [Cutaneotrichosporon oleaginosum]|uniref:Uncharacterized protein n=1 Tax=Cutaneotrichosporon oleaginosum TaxID=879819 RepID=A0A0J0XIM4_9TREE|nr:uncharacterized protein CC85DRAFT_292952 [Cutaneotrichosporon oleaginosum]KLT40923.1 hypothetical protein CC85DRAFT_292952 [Cutaneotrichosporon oleaginosum]TXT15416.1 hypothetical protein COLE_01609 [Cutaneotrichosporon oleaginosum]
MAMREVPELKALTVDLDQYGVTPVFFHNKQQAGKQTSPRCAISPSMACKPTSEFTTTEPLHLAYSRLSPGLAISAQRDAWTEELPTPPLPNHISSAIQAGLTAVVFDSNVLGSFPRIQALAQDLRLSKCVPSILPTVFEEKSNGATLDSSPSSSDLARIKASQTPFSLVTSSRRGHQPEVDGDVAIWQELGCSRSIWMCSIVQVSSTQGSARIPCVVSQERLTSNANVVHSRSRTLTIAPYDRPVRCAKTHRVHIDSLIVLRGDNCMALVTL